MEVTHVISLYKFPMRRNELIITSVSRAQVAVTIDTSALQIC